MREIFQVIIEFKFIRIRFCFFFLFIYLLIYLWSCVSGVCDLCPLGCRIYFDPGMELQLAVEVKEHTSRGNSQRMLAVINVGCSLF